MRSPDRLVGVAGTGTEVGKTWVTAAVSRVLRADGVRVAARKPVQSFGLGDALDSAVLGAATGEASEAVCPRHRWFEVPMAPPMAAAALGRPAFTVADLVGELAWPEGIDVGFVETAGGVRSPIADDGDCASFLAAIAVDLVVLVADAGLGTINSVRLSCDSIAAPIVVFLNRYDEDDDLHRRNRDWLADRDGLDVVTTITALAGALR
ncbi:MAG TPA: dethiobiotin synthase [Acidimicrobiales bacterium]|nr:dethiobiotin synthase [Acidimicrobiales bacterium]